MIEIKSLDGLSFEELYSSFENAFADYDTHFSKEDLRRMLRRRGFNAQLSFGAFDNEDLVAFTFNGIGYFEGKRMAYDTGTGTVKVYRGQGLAGKIFEYSLPYLKLANITHYLLEVLQHNEPAISIYKKQGFEIRREFNYYFFDSKTTSVEKKTNSKIEVKEIELDRNKMASFFDFEPSWQNSFDSIERAGNRFVILGTYTDNQLVGYCVFESETGDLTQLAVDKNYRKQGIGTILLNEALKQNKTNKVKILNTESTCQSVNTFLKAFAISGKQYEMIKEL